MNAAHRVLTITLPLLALFVAPTGAHAIGDLNATATANGAGQIVIDWQWYEYPPEYGPVIDRPDWVGYDLSRRDVAACGPWMLVNADIIPRTPGVTHGGSYVDPSPASGVTWEYRLVPVDASRNPVLLLWPDFCEPPCAPHMWESAPTMAAPVTVGQVVDWGWTVAIEPCPDGCWSGFYVAEDSAIEALRPYAGTGQVLRIYGDEGCGSVEGCAIGHVDRFEPTLCGPTPAARPSWGRVKTLYR